MAIRRLFTRLPALHTTSGPPQFSWQGPVRAAPATAAAAALSAASRVISTSRGRADTLLSVRCFFSIGSPSHSATVSPTPSSSSSSSSSSTDDTEKSPRKTTGLHKVCDLASPLAEFMGKSQASRVEVTKFIWAYIKEKDLQKKENRRIVVADERLMPLLRQREMSMFELNKVLSKYIHNIPQQQQPQGLQQQRQQAPGIALRPSFYSPQREQQFFELQPGVAPSARFAVRPFEAKRDSRSAGTRPRRRRRVQRNLRGSVRGPQNLFPWRGPWLGEGGGSSRAPALTSSSAHKRRAQTAPCPLAPRGSTSAATSSHALGIACSAPTQYYPRPLQGAPPPGPCTARVLNRPLLKGCYKSQTRPCLLHTLPNARGVAMQETKHPI
ncbi:uncharacterized protein LOC113147097 [Cyclospora cayetanensis]|uniref:Uncharacterized protein LOC113147097 n=1 Tax=Cyclospora cayetanensis TaxID=88456 RepID=A0A6P6RXV0_9EIME|nr:uncharacterized protein LOC113147097 [Cyclospora cayetanensis]